MRQRGPIIMLRHRCREAALGASRETIKKAAIPAEMAAFYELKRQSSSLAPAREDRSGQQQAARLFFHHQLATFHLPRQISK